MGVANPTDRLLRPLIRQNDTKNARAWWMADTEESIGKISMSDAAHWCCTANVGRLNSAEWARPHYALHGSPEGLIDGYCGCQLTVGTCWLCTESPSAQPNLVRRV